MASRFRPLLLSALLLAAPAHAQAPVAGTLLPEEQLQQPPMDAQMQAQAAPAPMQEMPAPVAAAPEPAPMPQQAAAPSVDYRTPLLVVRFNQRNVYFEKSLNNAVSRALAIKPDTVFDVLLIPGAGSRNPAGSMDRIISSLRNMNVQPGRINTLQREAQNSRYDEVQVFVR